MIRLIAAHDQTRGIAKGGIQPWSIPDDERYFINQTKKYGGAILVGSTTFKTFKGPLWGQTNYVVTRSNQHFDGAIVVNDLESFVNTLTDDIWVIGGAAIYDYFIKHDLADELYLTQIEADFNCDQYFPTYDNFEEITKSDVLQENGFSYCYVTLAKTPIT